MEAVMNGGTAAGVRGMGFTAPAAGKTGTDHDAWFAGYTAACSALCGWATTITPRSIRKIAAASRARRWPRPSGQRS